VIPFPINTDRVFGTHTGPPWFIRSIAFIISSAEVRFEISSPLKPPATSVSGDQLKAAPMRSPG
jgi:hypothetical protein